MDMEPDPKSFPTGQQGRPVYGMPDPPRPRRSRLFLVGLPVLAVFTGFAAIVWMAYEGGAGSPAGEPPLIRAATSPIKLSPDQAVGSEVEEEGDVRELLSDIPFEQQLERLLPDLEEPLTPPPTVEQAEPAPQVAQVPGQMAAVDLPPPGEVDRPAEPSAAEVAPTPTQPAVSSQRAPTSPAPPAAESARPVAEPATPRPPATAQASEPEPTPASPAPGPTAEAALDALIAEVTQTLPRADRSTEATQSRTEPAPPRARREPTPPATARPRERQMAATTPNGRIDGSSTSREAPEPVITAAPSQSEAASGSGYRVQLAAVREQADAQRAWDLFMLDLGPILSRYQPYFERANTANGIFYRVQVGPFASAEAAETTCDELKQRNASCFVVRR